MNNKTSIESYGKNETYINGEKANLQEYHMNIPDGKNIYLDLNLNGEKYSIRDFTVNDLERMLVAPIRDEPSAFSKSIIQESDKYIQMPSKKSKKTSRTKSSPKKSSKTKSKTSKRTTKKSKKQTKKVRFQISNTPKQLTIY